MFSSSMRSWKPWYKLLYALTVLITLNTFWWQLVSHPVAQMINMLQNHSVFHKQVIKMCTFQSIIAISFWATCWFPEVKPLLFFYSKLRNVLSCITFWLIHSAFWNIIFLFIYSFTWQQNPEKKKIHQ